MISACGADQRRRGKRQFKGQLPGLRFKDRSGRSFPTVFSRNAPILAFNELKDQTDLDEQQGMMHRC
jgi:hypothetical protein